MADVFEIQDEIVASIVSALMPTLLARGVVPSAAPTVRRSTENLEAYELYLKGRHYWHQRSPATVRIAIQQFEQAIALDAEYALAYCGLADCYGILRVYGWMAPHPIREKAKAAVDRAMAIDASLAESNFSMGFYTFYFERKWREARPFFARSIEINPRASLHLMYFALFASMEYRADEVEQLLARSVALDPLSPFLHGLRSTAYYTMGMHEPALAAAQLAIELQPDYLLGIWTHGLALCALERYAEGIAQLERAVAMSRAPFFVCVLKLGLGLSGRADDARLLLAELDDRASRGEYVPPFTRLAIHVGLGNLVHIRRELAAALDEVTPPFSFRVTSGVFLDRYRSDPEVARLLDAWYAGERTDGET